MLPTNWNELKGAFQGALIAGATPWVLQWQVGDIKLWDAPLIAVALPCFFLGAFVGTYRAHQK